jgi:hypothetical protein
MKWTVADIIKEYWVCASTGIELTLGATLEILGIVTKVQLEAGQVHR